MEHEPDADEDGHFIDYLDKVVEVIVHRANRDEEGKHQCAKDVTEEDLEDDGASTKDDN